MKDSKKILKEYLIKAKHYIIKENMRQKAEIISLTKKLISQGVDVDKIKEITDFYKYSIDSSSLEIENENIFQEMITKLEALQ